MKSRIILIAALISLAFNIGFVATAMYRWCRQPGIPEGVPTGLRSRFHDMQHRVREQRERFEDSKRAFIQALSKDEIDPDELHALLEESIKIHAELEKEKGQFLIDAREHLGPEKFLELHRRIAPGTRPMHNRQRRRNQ